VTVRIIVVSIVVVSMSWTVSAQIETATDDAAAVM
jgi:hypothetical protein